MPSSSPLSSPARPTRPHTCSLLAAADTMTRATLRAGRAAGAGRRAAARAERAVCIGREMGGWERKVGSVVPHRVQPLFFRSQVLLPFSPSVASPRPTSSPGVPRAEATGCRVTVVEGSHCVCEGEGDGKMFVARARTSLFLTYLRAPHKHAPHTHAHSAAGMHPCFLCVFGTFFERASKKKKGVGGWTQKLHFFSSKGEGGGGGTHTTSLFLLLKSRPGSAACRRRTGAAGRRQRRRRPPRQTGRLRGGTRLPRRRPHPRRPHPRRRRPPRAAA